MKVEWLVINVTSVGSPDIAEPAIFGVVLAGYFLAISGRSCGLGAILWCRKILLSSNNFSYGRVMKTLWLVACVTSVGSPDRAERTNSGMILA